MALINCYECNKEISDTTSACPHCGAKKKSNSPNLWLLIPAGIAMFIVLITAAKNDNAGAAPDGKADSRRAISFCWEQYEKKSIGDSEKRFIAGACEKMEKDFTDKYHVKP